MELTEEKESIEVTLNEELDKKKDKMKTCYLIRRINYT